MNENKCDLNSVREDLTERKHLSQDMKEAKRGVWQKSGSIIPGRANSKCKGPVAGVSLAISRNRKEISVIGAGRFIEDEAQEITGWRWRDQITCWTLQA